MSTIDLIDRPSVKGPPPVVQVNELQFARLGLISVVERAVKRNGDIVTLNMPGDRKMTVLASASHAAFWQENPDAFHKDLSDPNSGVSLTRKVLGDTLLTANADKDWQQMRRDMVSLLSKSKTWFQRPLAAATDQLIADMTQRPDVPLLEHCIAWATRAICDPLIGERALDAAAQKIVYELNDCFMAVMADPETAHLAQTQQRYQAVMTRVLNERGPQSLANHVLETSQDVTDRVALLRNVVGGLLVASLHINALSLFWALTQLAECPDIQSQVGQEAERWGDKPRRVVDTPLAYACVREAQRIKPVMAFIERQVAQQIEIGDHTLSAGDTVLFSPWLVQRSQDTWQNPMVFDPDNFARGQRLKTGSYFPFGLGPRQCPGTNLVNQQLTFAISRVFNKLHLRSNENTRPGDIAPMFRVNLEPRGAVCVSATPIGRSFDKEI